MPPTYLPDDPTLIPNCRRLLELYRDLAAVRTELKTASGQHRLDLEKSLRGLNTRCGQLFETLRPTFEVWIRKAIKNEQRILDEFAQYLELDDLVQEVLIRMWKTPPDQEPTENPVARLRQWVKTVVTRYLMDVLEKNSKKVLCEEEDEFANAGQTEPLAGPKGANQKRIRRELVIFTLSMQGPGDEAEESWKHYTEEHEHRFLTEQAPTTRELRHNEVLDAFGHYFEEVWPTLMSPDCYAVLKLDYEYHQQGKTQFGAEVAAQLGIGMDALYKRRERYREALILWWLELCGE